MSTNPCRQRVWPFLVFLIACTEQPGSELSTANSTAEASKPVFVLAAGDIAGCPTHYKDEATAKMVSKMTGTILALGDVVYQAGSRWQFRNCYDPTWGKLRSRTRPTPGNHEYRTDQAGPYYEYFGDRAGPNNRGYYTFTLGTWRIYSLNSERNIEAQRTWLRNHLKNNPSKCVLAYWHKPYYTSGPNPPTLTVRPLFQELWKARADVVLNGHQHNYERFAPQDADSVYRKNGVRQFVVGTGGAEVKPATGRRAKNSKVLYAKGWGVLELKLEPGKYSWRFVPIPGSPKADSGSAACV